MHRTWAPFTINVLLCAHHVCVCSTQLLCFVLAEPNVLHYSGVNDRNPVLMLLLKTLSSWNEFGFVRRQNSFSFPDLFEESYFFLIRMTVKRFGHVSVLLSPACYCPNITTTNRRAVPCKHLHSRLH